MNKDEVIVNNKYPVKGEFVVETHSEMVSDKESATGIRQEITIKGKMSCEEYFPIMHTLENDRYKVSNITVNTEGFVSSTNTIDYVFTCDNFLVKVGDPNAER